MSNKIITRIIPNFLKLSRTHISFQRSPAVPWHYFQNLAKTGLKMHLVKVPLEDPSLLYRPENNFRNYEIDKGCPEHVKRTYYDMHRSQTLDFVRKKHLKWLQFNHIKLTIMEALELMNLIIDESDPDTSLPNIVHSFQTAERIRDQYPKDDWFHLTGLIHDMGKILAIIDPSEPQWAIVGDTYPLGCALSPHIVFGKQSFAGNKDWFDNDSKPSQLYYSPNGIYEANCGLNKLIMSWGHDEYLYQVLKHNTNNLPDIACNIIRFHSFYPWHKSGAYTHLCTDEDLTKTLNYVQIFNGFDLYSKSDSIPDIDAIKPYYNDLITKYFGSTERKLLF